jgi:hypothetical protein
MSTLKLYNNLTFPKRNRSSNTNHFNFIQSDEDEHTYYYRRTKKSIQNPKVGDRIYLRQGIAYNITSVQRRPPGVYKGSKNCGIITVSKCIS